MCVGERRSPDPRDAARVSGWHWQRQSRHSRQNAPTAVAKPRARRRAAVRRARSSGSWLRWPASRPSCTLALVWIPTIVSIILSFTDWKGIRFDDINWVGFQNYDQIFTVFEKNFFQALINNTVLLIFLFIGPTALGIVPGVPAGPGHPRHALLPGRLLHAGRALAGRRRLHVAERDLLDRERPGHPDLRRRRADRLARQPVVPDSLWRDLWRLLELRGDPGGDRLAPHRLHHGALHGRAEERR